MAETASKGALAHKPAASSGGTDGGWTHTTPLKGRLSTPTGIMSFDGDSAWRQYDPHVVVPKSWGRQADIFKDSLRSWPEPDWFHSGGEQATWKHANVRRWPLHRVAKYNRTGVVVNL